MIRCNSRKIRTGFYDPYKVPAKTNIIVTIVCVALFGAAAFYSIVSTLDEQQMYHCQQGWQRACEALK